VPLARRLSVLTDQSLTARRADSLHVRFGPGLIHARNDASRHGAQTMTTGVQLLVAVPVALVAGAAASRSVWRTAVV